MEESKVSMNINQLPYLNYPNPRYRRKEFKVINGIWDFEFIDKMEIPQEFTKKIKVPFTYETEYSLIGEKTMHEYVAYRRTFISEANNYLLHLEGIDYLAKVFIDKKEVGEHTGTYTSFTIPLQLQEGEHEIIILVHDSFSKSQLRGKQRTRGENYECWYTQFTGIYKDIYLEKVGDNYIEEVLLSGDKNGLFNYNITLKNPGNIKLTISKDNQIIDELYLAGQANYAGAKKEENIELYSHESPSIYDVKVELENKDTLETYFGFRTIETKDEKLLINDKPLYLKMVLNQGYYDKKGITPEKEDVIKDLSLIQEIGFNGIRIHQKQEVNLFYYIADYLGIYLWSEIPSCYEYSSSSKKDLENQLPEIIKKNYNSPSILTYVLFNESWGVPEIDKNSECQSYINTIGKKIKKLDSTRLVILNDGWFQLTDTDILSLHEYEQNSKVLHDYYSDKNEIVSEKIINHYGKAFATDNHYKNQPIIISEFGGASLTSSDGWGYGDKRQSIKDYHEQLENIFLAVTTLPYLSGYCYTQLTDVEQETNGLFYPDRTPKLPLEEMRKIIVGE